MSKPPAPRTAALAALLLGGALLGASCDRAPSLADPPDPPPPPTGDALVVAVVAPAGDTLTGLGVDIRVTRANGAPIRSVRLFVDSGTATQREYAWAYDAWYTSGTDSVRTMVYAPGTGRHTFTVSSADSGRQASSARFTRTFTIPDVPYAVTALPDLGAGAGAEGMDEGGDVAGWVRTPDGQKRPALWRRGQLTVLPADTGDVVALKVNAAGDALLQFLARAPALGARVRRADGRELAIGPLSVPMTSIRGGLAPCCGSAGDLNERRQAVATTPDAIFYYGSVLLDVASGVVSDSSETRLTTLNDRGQAAGTVSNFATTGLYPSTRLAARGFTPPPFPSGTVYAVCDRPQRFSLVDAVDLDDDANLLAARCGNVAYLPQRGAAVWLDRFVGLGAARLSRTGGVVASVDPGGDVWLWRAATGPTSHVRLADARWRVDSLAAVTSGGVIAASGVDASGRRAALLLSPGGAR